MVLHNIKTIKITSSYDESIKFYESKIGCKVFRVDSIKKNGYSYDEIIIRKRDFKKFENKINQIQAICTPTTDTLTIDEEPTTTTTTTTPTANIVTTNTLIVNGEPTTTTTTTPTNIVTTVAIPTTDTLTIDVEPTITMQNKAINELVETMATLSVREPTTTTTPTNIVTPVATPTTDTLTIDEEPTTTTTTTIPRANIVTTNTLIVNGEPTTTTTTTPTNIVTTVTTPTTDTLAVDIEPTITAQHTNFAPHINNTQPIEFTQPTVDYPASITLPTNKAQRINSHPINPVQTNRHQRIENKMPPLVSGAVIATVKNNFSNDRSKNKKITERDIDGKLVWGGRKILLDDHSLKEGYIPKMDEINKAYQPNSNFYSFGNVDQCPPPKAIKDSICDRDFKILDKIPEGSDIGIILINPVSD